MDIPRLKKKHQDQLTWFARTDVGLQRPHNEDSYVDVPPLFAVCDGMGGHEAGEIASAIAIDTIVEQAPDTLDDEALGKAIEAANMAILTAVEQGVGKAGMGCTATAVMIIDEKMAVAHVGDSRCYLLRAGSLVRVTHDHSYVEELVDAGEITADEARTHPARSIITRALGSESDLYADHFTIDIEKGDRVILCSDGLNSMISDEFIEDLALTSPTPKECTDRLIAAALAAGGHDNVTVVVVDVERDVVAELHDRIFARGLRRGLVAVLGVLIVAAFALNFIISNSWFLGIDSGRVAIYHGINASFIGRDLYELVERTEVDVRKLPDATRKSLEEGIATASREEARSTVDSYVSQIVVENTKTAETADAAANAKPDTGAAESKDSAKPSSGGDTKGGDAS